MNIPPLTIVTDWVLSNRCGKAFEGYTRDQILIELTVSSVLQSGIVYSTEEDGIIGVVTAEMDHTKKLCYVQNVLAIKKGVIGGFIRYFNHHWPSYKLSGYRHGKMKHFNRINILEQKLPTL